MDFIFKSMKKQKTFYFFIISFLLFSSFIQSHEDKDPQLELVIYSPYSANFSIQCFSDDSAQSSQAQNDPYNFPIINNGGFSQNFNTSFNFNSYQHAISVLNNCVVLPCGQQKIAILRQDIDLIDLICKDNPHYDQNSLRLLLAKSSAFNCARQFFKEDHLLHVFKSDIFINPAHFKNVADSANRIKMLYESAKQAMDNRHESEKINLKSKHRVERKTAKKKSSSEKNKVKNRHKQELEALDKKQTQEKKHPLGIKKQIPEKEISQPQKNHSLKISQQRIQDSWSYNKFNIIKYQNSGDDSFKKIMDQRSVAFQDSLNSPNFTAKQSTINPQTAGFLQTQGIDTQQFQQMQGLPIQHQLTAELVDILDTVAFHVLESSQWNQADLDAYIAEMDELGREERITEGALELGLERGLERGLELGAQKKSEAMAIKLLKKNIDINEIADLIDLSIEQIKKLHSKL